LNANLDEKIYVQISIGDKIFKCGKSKLLQKALYGLKQVGRKWFHEISDFLKKIRLIINIIFFFFFFFFLDREENTLTIINIIQIIVYLVNIKNNKLCLLLTLYIDDILIARENKEIYQSCFKDKT